MAVWGFAGALGAGSFSRGAGFVGQRGPSWAAGVSAAQFRCSRRHRRPYATTLASLAAQLFPYNTTVTMLLLDYQNVLIESLLKDRFAK